jgi:hypothetical protein
VAGSVRYTAILDANVLYPQLIRDTLLSLADAILTFNTKDFPMSVLAPHGIEMQHPDEFLMNQLQLQEIPALRAIKMMRARWTNPARPTQELITAFEKRGLPMTTNLLREAVTLI